MDLEKGNGHTAEDVVAVLIMIDILKRSGSGAEHSALVYAVVIARQLHFTSSPRPIEITRYIHQHDHTEAE